MARTKDPVKPLFAVKHDFYTSLDAFAHQSIVLLQVVEKALELGAVSEKVAPMLRERVDAFRAALLSDD